jgi:hypothetical protein
MSAHNEIKKLLENSITDAAFKSQVSKESMMTDCFAFYKKTYNESELSQIKSKNNNSGNLNNKT